MITAEQVAELVASYAALMRTLTNETELCFPYAVPHGQSAQAHQKDLSAHDGVLTLIIAAVVAEIARDENVNPAILTTLSSLMPAGHVSRSATTQDALLETLAEKVGRFQAVLETLNADPASLAKGSMAIKQEMEQCRHALTQLESSPEWLHLQHLASVKLLHRLVKAGAQLHADGGDHKPPRPGH